MAADEFASVDNTPPLMALDAMNRGTALSPTEILRLDQWAESLTWTFEPGPYLVGSALTRRDYRDVDVRVRLDDDDPLLADPDRLRIINVALSVWAQQVSGLPVDFQFQSRSEWEANPGLRNPLGGRWRTVHKASLTGRSNSDGSGVGG